MNRKLALALIAAALAAGNAFADDITVGGSPSPFTPFVSTKTRAEVKAELAEYQRANPWAVEQGFELPATDFRGTLTRAQVQAELAEYKRTHPWPIQDEVFGDYRGLVSDTATVAGQPVNAR